MNSVACGVFIVNHLHVNDLCLSPGVQTHAVRIFLYDSCDIYPRFLRFLHRMPTTAKKSRPVKKKQKKRWQKLMSNKVVRGIAYTGGTLAAALTLLELVMPDEYVKLVLTTELNDVRNMVHDIDYSTSSAGGSAGGSDKYNEPKQRIQQVCNRCRLYIDSHKKEILVKAMGYDITSNPISIVPSEYDQSISIIFNHNISPPSDYKLSTIFHLGRNLLMGKIYCRVKLNRRGFRPGEEGGESSGAVDTL